MEEMKQEISTKRMEFKGDDVQIQITNHDNKAEIIFEGLNLEIVMTLRTIMMTKLPVLAIDDVSIKTNTSFLPNQMLIDRLGLVPILSNCNQFTEWPSITFELCVTNNTDKPLSIYSGDLKIVSYCNIDDNIKLAYSDILIARLDTKQQIILNATTRKGTGEEHLKFQSIVTSPVVLKNEKNQVILQIEAIADICPIQYLICALEYMKNLQKHQEIDVLIKRLKDLNN